MRADVAKREGEDEEELARDPMWGNSDTIRVSHAEQALFRIII